jgi:hypothetical protein
MLQCVIDSTAGGGTPRRCIGPPSTDRWGSPLEVGVCEMICDYAKYECDERRLPDVNTLLRTCRVYFNRSSISGQCRVFRNGKVLWKGAMQRGYDVYARCLHASDGTLYIVLSGADMFSATQIMKFVNGVIVQSNEYDTRFNVTGASFDETCIRLHEGILGTNVPMF